ncbi:hypothetical protein CK227_10510 [Mesorhizobium sp. WSM4308]|uniref:acyltransferase family protein n=1 Tax=Mesorhizobium sp. WSM4308 TaxID=2029409 RepID=UPI000BB07EF9|nr:acyltransferase [Mesorhizobium sp. WSM4308]PBB75215.1 hypothetical protein CK227_10510 [Mesorhizobium sp. WSM4308]
MLKAVGTETPTKTIQRYVALDGLRGLAAYTVVVSHYIGSASPVAYPGQSILGALHLAGQVGVMLFFVISGFLMGELYMHSPFTLENIRSFYVKRIARVVPLYYVVVLVSFALPLVANTRSVWPFYYIGNVWSYLLFWRGANVLWTIPAEVQFYALFPAIWWAFSKIGNTTILLLLVVAALNQAFWLETPVLLQSFLPYFAAGLVLSMITVPYARLIEFLVIPAFIGLVVALPEVSVALGFKPTGMWGSSAYMLLVPTTVLLVINSRWATRILGSRLAIFLGTISYSVYLLHMPVHFVLRELPIYKTAPLLLMAVALVVTTAVSWLSFMFIEKPARRWIYSYA